MADLGNINDLMDSLDKLVLRTEQGAYIKVDDLKRVLEERHLARAEEEKDRPKPKTFAQAKEMAKKDEDITKHFPTPKPQLGRVVTAREPQPASRP